MVQAEAAFSSKDYFRASSFYAKVNSLFKFTILVYLVNAFCAEDICLSCSQLSSSNTWEFDII